MSNIFSFRLLAIASASIAGVVAACAVVQAATDTIYKYSTPKTGYYAVSAFSMTPDADGTDYFVNYSTSALSQNMPNGSCFQAGVNLPNGATITGVAVYFRSGALADDPNFQLFQTKLLDGTQTVIVNEDANDGSNDRKGKNMTMLVPNVTVNNQVNTYGFAVCLNAANNEFFGARITYSYNNAGD